MSLVLLLFVCFQSDDKQNACPFQGKPCDNKKNLFSLFWQADNNNYSSLLQDTRKELEYDSQNDQQIESRYWQRHPTALDASTRL